ncbi:type I polyketide synthase [Mycolicibacterium mengxianglii]|uniref:type I polyketide synthase n=1 Tax=Mycolicibacterium mengxianglii TaxID=2736649 RepID=UPI0018EEE212|nr:type I polyketide synthase [Mycolicibacterium mengxianglii]
MSAAPLDRRAVVAEALKKIDDLSARLEIAEQGDVEPIAVVGMGCRLPGGVDSPGQYWQLLREGGSGIVRVPAQRWDADAYYSPDPSVAGTICTREGGFLTSWQPDEFDAEFFGMSPREAAGMDPQQRLLLEVAWEALENAGVTAEGIRGSQTAVFVGLTTSDYSYLAFSQQLRPEDVDPYIAFGNASNFAAGRLSYFLGVHGPAVVVDTACSSSLVAVHLACQSLRRRESDQALAAGVNLVLTPEGNIACSRWGMLAPDGQCKTFDADADGYVRSEGCGVVVLKRLSDAVRDGDSVLAVVRGSAVNQDGPSSGQTVPSGPAQQAVVRAALAASRLGPADIDFVEAHGTGTALGDPIELDALSQVFGERGGAAPLVLGSVKTNVGHLESAAGIAGFIKTVLSVRHGVIPRHLHFKRLTPHAGVDASRFTIAAQEMVWPAVGRVRRAGVSSFGVSGTNAHVVVEQAPVVEPVLGEPVGEPVVSTLLVSGKSSARVASTAAMLAQWMVGEGAQVPLVDVAHTLNYHRSRYKSVAAVCARDRAQAVAGLEALAGGLAAPGVVGAHEVSAGSGTVFVYSGQGSQWAGMGQRLLVEEPAFAAAVAELEPVFVEQVGFSLQQVLEAGEQVSGDAQVQPVIMGVQLALTALWRSYGVEPDAVMGHSMGEVAAAVVAGALSVADGLKVIATRSKLMARLAGEGAVALVELDAAAAEKLITKYPGVEVTVYASPRQTVVAGPVDMVEAVIADVAARDRFARRVNMEVASHTALMDPILTELAEALAGLTPATPKIPFLSTVDAQTHSPAFDARYWVDNLRRPVRFSQAVATAAERCGTFVEISPHPTLTHAITETLEVALPDVHTLVVASLKRDDDETLCFHTQLAELGHTSPHTHTTALTGLPRTPWHHGRHWINVENPVRGGSAPKAGTLLGEHVALATTPPGHLWQARLVPGSKPYPGGHRVHGVELVPASMLLQALSAAAGATGEAVLSDVRFEYPIVLDQTRLVQVVTDGEVVTISSAVVSDGAVQRWVRHATGRIDRGRRHGEPGAVSDIGHPTDNNGSEPVLVASVVDELKHEWGIEGQPFPWSISSHHSIPGGLHARIRMSDPSVVALLDAGVHLARMADSSNRELLMPAAVESVQISAEFAEGHDVVEVCRRDGEPGELVVDFTVRAPDGSVGIHVRGLRFAAVESGSTETDPCALAHAIEWEPLPEDPDSRQASGSMGTLAVVGDEGAAPSLRDGLAAVGYVPADLEVAQYVIYVADPGPLNAGETDIDCAVRLTAEVADLARRLAKRQSRATLWILTRGVRECASDAGTRQSSLWGLAGVIGAEQPDIWGGLVDLPADGCIAVQAAALSAVLPKPARSVLVLRDGAFFTPAVSPIVGEPVREPLRCRPDAAYLITGGLGALGLLMAGWLADRGARRLVLAGRTALPPRREWNSDANDAALQQKISAVRALENRGVAVDAVAVDVGSEEAVRTLLALRDEAGEPTIRGVIHAAGVTEGQLLTEIEESRLRRTMWPKVSGARVLHEVFPPRSLDFFFLTSAAGAVFGVPGQGAYASANAYLDGLARARHHQGCHTVSLNWVAWRGLGFATEAEVVLDELERMGSRPITPQEAFPAWEYVDTFDIAQAVMVPLSSRQPGVDHESRSPARPWSEMAVEGLLVELEAELKKILSREIGLPEAEIDVGRPFAEMGLNSVMAMSIRRDAERLLGIELSATMLWNHPTVSALTVFLANKLLPQDISGEIDELLSDSQGSVLDDLFGSVESAAFPDEGVDGDEVRDERGSSMRPWGDGSVDVPA